MFEFPRSSDSRLRRCPIRAVLVSVGLLAFLVGPFAAQKCAAQSADDTGDQSYDQQTYQVQNQQTGEMTEQDLGLTPDQDDGQDSSQQNGQPPNQQWNQRQNQQPGQVSDQESGQMQQQNQQQSGRGQNQQPVQRQRQPEVTAEQLISLLQREPLVLDDVRSLVAKRAGLDSTLVNNEMIFERIREDASLRELIMRILIRRGYGPDLAHLSDNISGNISDNRPEATNERQPGTTQRRPANPPPPTYKNPDNPQVQLQLSPYRNMPSLTDLYSQFPSVKPKLRRFGSEAFLIGNENPSPGRTGTGTGTGIGTPTQLPMDLPAGPDYVLGPGDSLILNMWGGRSSRLSRVIDRQGQVDLPEAGTVMIDGLTMAQAEAAIQKALDTQFNGEHVEISLGRLRSVRVYVVGDVQRPGAYDVSSLSTPLGALYAAGGPTSHGSLRILRQYRGKQLVRQFDLYDFLLRGVRTNDDRLLPGDTILVPPTGPQITVEGAVRRPAIYELNGEQGLSQVLDLSGGLLVSANLKQIRVERIEAHESRTMFNLQIPDGRDEIEKELAAFKVQDGDDVVISQIMPYNDQAVYLEGHVFHPGKYPYQDGMTITDILHSYQDMMPEPSDHAEIIRLQPPDLKPEAINLNLHDVLIGNESIPLHPFDLIRIYGRYEIDAPNVTIQGEVIRPGKYPMSEGMTAADLVRLAGGFRRSAFTNEADLSSYSVQDGQRVLINHTDFVVQKAVDGDKNSDIVLKPGDVVSIRSIAGWQDIGATVTIQGEVEHAGSYGIQDGERLSSVLQRAGGFRKDAYPYAARLERVQVRELNEQARNAMIRRIEETPITTSQSTTSSSSSNQSAESARAALEAQRQEILMNLRGTPANGRMVISISSDISKWANTSSDIEVRAGDELNIPKRPEFVMTSGQVYNSVAITYAPGKELSWYLRKSGGATRNGDKKQIYVLRADGSVVPRDTGWMGNNFMNLRMRPGDTIVVPEKIGGGSQAWTRIAASAQAMTAVMIPLAATGLL
jgi:protein involved in polysaccharide export with SLBB domain